MSHFDQTSSRPDGWIARVLRQWKLLLAGTLVGIVVAGGLALLQTRIYRAQALLAPVSPESDFLGLSGTIGGFGAIANMLGTTTASDQFNRSVATLRSRKFCEMFVDGARAQADLQREMSARKSLPQWFRRSDKPPTSAELCKFFDESVRQVTVDPRTRFVTISVRNTDRHKAADSANQLVLAANQMLREQAISEATQSINFLTAELLRTESVEVRQAIGRAIESKLQLKTMAATRPDFAFAVIDPAVVPDPDGYESPRPLLAAAAGGAAAAFFAALIILWLPRPKIATVAPRG